MLGASRLHRSFGPEGGREWQQGQTAGAALREGCFAQTPARLSVLPEEGRPKLVGFRYTETPDFINYFGLECCHDSFLAFLL